MTRRQTDPFLNRISSIENRIKYYEMLSSELSSIEEVEDIKVLKENGKDSVLIVSNKIILQKRIGSESKTGIVYYSHLDDTLNKLFKFATKIMPFDDSNMNEIEILEELTMNVVGKTTPHFPIMYKYLVWDIEGILYKKIKKSVPKLISKAITKNEKLLFICNEIADGDFKSFRKDNYLNVNNKQLIKNAFSQMIMSIFSLYTHMDLYHNDAHGGNFLFHKIKAGGYFHYYSESLDLHFYIENIGFLWFIWDFEYVSTFKKEIKNAKKNKDETITMHDDIVRIFEYALTPSFSGETNYPFSTSLYASLDDIYQYAYDEGNKLMLKRDEMTEYMNKIINMLIKKKYIITDTPTNASANIINDKPYIIS